MDLIAKTLTRAFYGTVLTLVTAPAVLAAVPEVGIDNLNTGQSIINTIFKLITLAAVILFVILLVVGGIQYLASFGNEEATTKAKKLIVDAVVGLFIVLAAAGIANYVFDLFGVTGIQVNPGRGISGGVGDR